LEFLEVGSCNICSLSCSACSSFFLNKAIVDVVEIRLLEARKQCWILLLNFQRFVIKWSYQRMLWVERKRFCLVCTILLELDKKYSYHKTCIQLANLEFHATRIFWDSVLEWLSGWIGYYSSQAELFLNQQIMGQLTQTTASVIVLAQWTR
jgi:hypothetical protein